jgi:uncharacterized membrane protein YfcA
MFAHITDALEALAPWQWGLALFVIAFATVVQFRAGVGFGLFAAPLLALFAPQLVPVPILFLTLLSALAAVLDLRGQIDWREVAVSTAGRATGSVLALAVLSVLAGQKQFILVFGLLIALAVAMSLAGLRFRFNRRLLYVMGAISGLTATITSVGGPPMAIAYQDQKPERARPNMSAFFVLGNIVVIGALTATGRVSATEILYAAILFPALVVGVLIAPWFRGLIDRNFRNVLLGVAGASALLLIWRGLF